jgi:hypothetical protein
MSAYDGIESVASDGTRRAPGEATARSGSTPVRFSAQTKTALVLRLLRGEALDLLSREVGVPASRLAAWREAFLAAGPEAMKKRPAVEHDRALSRLREKLGESTMGIALRNEQLSRLETGRPVGPRRSRP